MAGKCCGGSQEIAFPQFSCPTSSLLRSMNSPMNPKAIETDLYYTKYLKGFKSSILRFFNYTRANVDFFLSDIHKRF